MTQKYMILAMALLCSACAQTKATCPVHVSTWSKEQQAKLAEELESLEKIPHVVASLQEKQAKRGKKAANIEEYAKELEGAKDSTYIKAALLDYAKMRNEVKTCQP